MNVTEACKGCRFARTADRLKVGSDNLFNCHRMPPIPTDITRVYQFYDAWHLPVVRGDSFCGEFQPRATQSA